MTVDFTLSPKRDVPGTRLPRPIPLQAGTRTRSRRCVERTSREPEHGPCVCWSKMVRGYAMPRHRIRSHALESETQCLCRGQVLDRFECHLHFRLIDIVLCLSEAVQSLVAASNAESNYDKPAQPGGFKPQVRPLGPQLTNDFRFLEGRPMQPHHLARLQP